MPYFTGLPSTAGMVLLALSISRGFGPVDSFGFGAPLRLSTTRAFPGQGLGNPARGNGSRSWRTGFGLRYPLGSGPLREPVRDKD